VGTQDYSNDAGITGQVLVVDDVPSIRTAHRGILAKQFDVLTASSGTEALAMCHERMPDLILLDIEMPDMNGTETCRQLRTWSSVPVIFATGHETIEEHMKAYDSGGNDIVVKPVSAEILLRKVALAIQQHRTAACLVEEKDSMQRMAMSFLSTMGQSGALLNFMRASVTCRTHLSLAEKLLETTSDMGVQCSAMIRHEDGPTVLTSHGEPSPLELAILEKSAAMGRIFQFKRQLVVNYDHVTLIVSNMPEDDGEAGRLRDNITILAETTEGLSEIVGMRLESMRRAEQLQIALSGADHAISDLRSNYAQILSDARMLTQELVDNIERSFCVLDTNEAQEREISQTMDHSVQRIFSLLVTAGNFDQQFNEVLRTLRQGSGDNLELF
jgi:DNA-binding response OmpR family regulator